MKTGKLFVALLCVGAWGCGPSVSTEAPDDSAGFHASIKQGIDLTPPSVQLTEPSEGATVSGDTVVAARATDNAGISRVEFWSGPNHIATDTTAPYRAFWNTRRMMDGSAQVYAIAYDTSGNFTYSNGVIVNVRNSGGGGDRTAPTVEVTSPTMGETVTGPILITADASDNVGVERVQFFVDDQLVWESLSPPYKAGIETARWPNGRHKLQAKARDRAGYIGSSEAVYVIFSNGSNLPLLQNGVPVTGLSALKGETIEFALEVPTEKSRLDFTTSEGTGDVDLYARFAAKPTSNGYDCKSDGPTTEETCGGDQPRAGTWYVTLYAYADFEGVSVVARHR